MGNARSILSSKIAFVPVALAAHASDDAGGGLLGAVTSCRFATYRGFEGTNEADCLASKAAAPTAISRPLSEPGAMVVHPILRSLRWTGGPERIFTQLLDVLPKGSVRTIVDVGANRGSLSAEAARRGHRVIAFEPVPNNIDAFTQTVRGYGPPDVTLITKGVGDQPAVVHMRGNSDGKSTVMQGSNKTFDVGATVALDGCKSSKVSCHKIHITTLDIELANVPSIFIMKLDIQGFESRAFRGAGDLLRRRAVDVFIIEFDPGLQRSQGGSCEEICLRLHAAGYVFFEGAVIRHSLHLATVRDSLGETLAVHEYIDMLRGLQAYTDLVAIRFELVPRVLVDGNLLDEVRRAGGRRARGRGAHRGSAQRRRRPAVREL